MIARSPQDIGLLMRERRRKLGLDQAELARRCRVSRRWIIEAEKGKASAEVGLVLRALAVLGLRLDLREADAPSGAAVTRAAANGAAPAEVNLDAVIARARGERDDLPAPPRTRAKAGPKSPSSKLAKARRK